MEERIIEDPRKVKIKTNAVGGIDDATDPLADGDEGELLVDLDEDLVGLSPSELEEALRAREKAAKAAEEQRDKHLAEAEAALKKRDYARAETFFSQAALYDADCARAKEGVWICRTRDFAETEPLFVKENAEEIAANEETRAFVKERAGEALSRLREEYAAEEEPLRAREERAAAARTEKFRLNRNYYLLRFGIFAALVALFAIGAGVSAAFLFRTTGMIPVILLCVFSGLAAFFAIFAIVYARKLFEAERYVLENKRPDATEDGARLLWLQSRLACISLILEGK